jgi:hypothetical protein
MYLNQFADYVPQPDPVSSDYIIACHYYPGWTKKEKNIHNGFDHLWDYPERTPLIGYYEESLPEVTDWEIKWAVEHGINCFIYCWYRKKENVGKPVTRADLRLGHAIHEGLFSARYQNMMKFAIMWEGHNWGVAKDRDDLLQNLLPFWFENYFTKPNYLVIENQPVLFVYDYADHIFDGFGNTVYFRDCLEDCREIAKKYGFDGIKFCAEYRYEGEERLLFQKDCGYDHSFAYCWHTKEKNPTDEAAIENQMNLMEKHIAFDPYFSLLTCSVGWDPRPWAELFHMTDVTSWKLTPKNWKLLLQKVKELADHMPQNSFGKKFILLDNWNEWCEGHYISPHLSGGFQYLQAVREEFTKLDNLPDYRLPSVLGLDSYENGWEKPKSK